MNETIPSLKTGVERLSAMLEHERTHNGLTGWHMSLAPFEDHSGCSNNDLADDAADMLQAYLDGKCTDITEERL